MRRDCHVVLCNEKGRTNGAGFVDEEGIKNRTIFVHEKGRTNGAGFVDEEGKKNRT